MTEKVSDLDPDRTITALEVANFVVCPESFRLKSLRLGRRQTTSRVAEAHSSRQEWVRQQDLSNHLRHYAKIAYALMVLIVVVLFLFERPIMQKFRKVSAQKQIQEINNPNDQTR